MRKVHGGRHLIDSEKRRLSRRMKSKFTWEMVNTAYFQACLTKYLNKPVEPSILVNSARTCFCSF